MFQRGDWVLSARCVETFHRVFEAAGLTVVKQENQPNFPKTIFQVTM